MILRAAAAAILIAAPAAAQDDVRARGPLGDADFYRLVACGRPPGGHCRIPMRRWPPDLATALTVAKLPDIEPVSPVIAAQIAQALDKAISEINGVGAGLHLTRLPDNSPAAIRLQIRSPRSMAIASGITSRRDRPAGMVIFVPFAPDRISGASIMIASDIGLRETNSVVLEELTQSLGLPFDISDKAYTRRSIFAQDSNAVTRLTGQDAAAIRLHYPSSP